MSPYFLEASGSTPGAKDLVLQAPETLYDGSDIASDPVVTYRWRVRRVDTGALVGGTPIDVAAPTLTFTATGLPATTLRATASAINSVNEESQESLPVEWVGT